MDRGPLAAWLKLFFARMVKGRTNPEGELKESLNEQLYKWFCGGFL